ncbi:MAG: hypothetical protein JWO82_771 [Akkermansiaceae bacterium]|nr:hypothetical protein [Akkermansiaceae bacterium]
MSSSSSHFRALAKISVASAFWASSFSLSPKKKPVVFGNLSWAIARMIRAKSLPSRSTGVQSSTPSANCWMIKPCRSGWFRQ